MIGFLRKNNNHVVPSQVNNNGSSSPNVNSSNGHKNLADSCSDSDASQDVTIQDIKARYSNRQPRDGSCSGRSQNGRNANLKLPGLGLLQVTGAGFGVKAPLTSRAKKNSYRSRNDPINALGQAQTCDDDSKKAAEDIKFPNLVPNNLFSSQKSNATLETGSTDMASVISFNNTRGTFRKKMSKLNNDALSKNIKQDLRDQLKNLKETPAQSRNVNIFNMKTNNTEQQANLEPLLVATEKVKLYKQYTIDMSEKQQKFEEESQRHFANTIKKHQEQTEQILKNKDTIVELMVQDKNKSMDELNSLRARLYRAKAEGKLEQFFSETQEETKASETEGSEDPVNLEEFETLKALRNEQKNQNIAWINDFKNNNERDPTDEELDEIREQIESYNTNNNKYILMKTIMIRQGVIPYNFVNKAANQKMSLDQSTEQDAFNNNSEIYWFRAETLNLEKQNMELEDEIQRLRYNLNKVSDEQKVEGLQGEIMRKEEQMKEKNDLINNLNSEKAIVEQEKVVLKNEMEQLRLKQVLVRNVAVMHNKQRAEKDAEKDAEHEKELSDLQAQNAQLKEQVVALQQLQIQTVTGGSVLETREEMEELPKTALVRDEEMEEIFQQEARTSEDIISSYIAKFEALVQTAEEVPEAADDDKDATPLLQSNTNDCGEEEPLVVDLSAVHEEEDVLPVVREVVETSTFMDVVPDNEEILERQREHERQLEEARDEAAAKDDEIVKLNDQVVMLEHAVFDRENELLDMTNEHYHERTKEFFENKHAKMELQRNIEELEEAVRSNYQAIEELEAQKKELKETHEVTVAEKEAQIEEMVKEHEAIRTDLHAQVGKLREELADQIATTEEQARQYEQTMAEKEEALKTDAERRIKEKEEEIQQLREELQFTAKEMQDRVNEIAKLQVELANQKDEEEKLLKRVEQLKKEADRANDLAEQLTQVTTKKDELLKETEHQQKELNRITEQFKDEQGKRKQILNELEDLKGKIRVYCRVRPFSKSEADDAAKQKMCVDINDEMSLTVKGRINQNYNFDSVFGPDSTQDQVFHETKRLVQSAIDGYNVCVFAYGQTGSGKTFTIQGNQANPGLTPRSIEEMYKLIGNMDQFDVELSCYMVEIYKGELRDLLLPKNVKDKPKLEVKQAQSGQVQIKNVTIKPLTTEADTNAVFETGLGGRQVRKTLMNDESSRSHLIFSIIIDATNKLTGKKSCGKLSFIDLAGSESSKKTGTDKEGQAEANAINQSLSALGNVISALADGAKFIRYKENLLTRLMQDSLGGNSKTLMFVNCSPSVYNEQETKNSLEYAKRVKEIKNNPMQNLESKAIQHANKQIEAQQFMIESLKGFAQDNGLGDKLAELLANLEKNGEEQEGSSTVFSLNLDAIKADDNQIKDKPATGRKSNELGRASTLKQEASGRPSMRPSQSGPIKQFKK